MQKKVSFQVQREKSVFRRMSHCNIQSIVKREENAHLVNDAFVFLSLTNNKQGFCREQIELPCVVLKKKKEWNQLVFY